MTSPSLETSTAPTHMVVGSEGMATISPFRSGSAYDAGAPALDLDPARQPSYTQEEAALVEAKVDRMLVRKIDLWPPEEIFELMTLLMKVRRGIGDGAGRREGEAGWVRAQADFQDDEA